MKVYLDVNNCIGCPYHGEYLELVCIEMKSCNINYLFRRTSFDGVIPAWCPKKAKGNN